jgi:hypothetical protein
MWLGWKGILLLVILLGIGLLSVAQLLGEWTDAFRWARRRTIEATGTITDVGLQTEAGRIGYYPWVRFTTRLGEDKHFMVVDRESRPRIVGSTVRVLYDAQNPNDANLAGTLKRRSVVLVCVIAMVLTVALVLVYQFQQMPPSGRP